MYWLNVGRGDNGGTWSPEMSSRDAVFVACSQWRAGHHMLCCHWLRGDVHSHRDL